MTIMSLQISTMLQIREHYEERRLLLISWSLKATLTWIQRLGSKYPKTWIQMQRKQRRRKRKGKCPGALRYLSCSKPEKLRNCPKSCPDLMTCTMACSHAHFLKSTKTKAPPVLLQYTTTSKTSCTAISFKHVSIYFVKCVIKTYSENFVYPTDDWLAKTYIWMN